MNGDYKNYWAIFIDIEGYSQLYNQSPDDADKTIVDFISDLYLIARDYFNHIAIIQYGSDGFLIYQNLTYHSILEQPISFATSILQLLIMKNRMGRATISCGKMYDIKELLPNEIFDNLNAGFVSIPNVTMQIKPMLGDAIINTFTLKGPKGPLLLIDNIYKDEIEKQTLEKYTILYNSSDCFGINWLKYRSSTVDKIQAGLSYKVDDYLIKNFKDYVENNKLSENWKRNALDLL